MRYSPSVATPEDPKPASRARRLDGGGDRGTARGRADLIGRIIELAPAVRKAFEVRPGAEERGAWVSLTAHQLEALSALSGGSLTMGELCERLDISESAGTALSDRLVAHGMVLREADPSDRRVVRLSLSEEARATVERFRALKRTRVAEVLAVLGDGELAALAAVYERLVARAPAGAGGRPAKSRRGTHDGEGGGR